METIRIHATDSLYGIQLGEVNFKVHSGEDCKGRQCCIHNPSDHPLKDAPLNWRADRRLMERLCPKCGCGHPDPDDLYYKKEILGIEITSEGIHGCCGACIGECES